MQTEQLVGREIACGCGQTHRIDPREVLYADDAIDRLPALCAGHTPGRRVGVLMDARTRAAAGAAIASAFRRDAWDVQEVLVPDRPGGGTVRERSPVCDIPTKERLAPRIGDVGLLVGVGGGVVSDLGKWIAFDRGVPAVTFGTAASMNGYAAANVAASVAGVKTVIRARPPVAVASSPAVLRAAPMEMTASGLGDVLAKSVSSTDWRMNHLLFGDYYCARSVGLIAEIEPLYLDDPEGIRDRRPRAMEALFDALLLTGIAMTMAETSDPASGGEHLISHTLDMTANARGMEHDLHGRQVGVGTILASELYRRVLAIESPTFTVPDDEVDRAYWGPLDDVVAEQHARKAGRIASAVEALSRGDAWNRLRAELSPMVRAPERIATCLRRAGAAWRGREIGCDSLRLVQALLHAHEMRGRFTILDLARITGVLPLQAEEIVERWG